VIVGPLFVTVKEARLLREFAAIFVFLAGSLVKQNFLARTMKIFFHAEMIAACTAILRTIFRQTKQLDNKKDE
jgi:precorrin-4 methylase